MVLGTRSGSLIWLGVVGKESFVGMIHKCRVTLKCDVWIVVVLVLLSSAKPNLKV